MSDESKTEQQIWRDLVNSDGWTRLMAHVKAEWDGPTFIAQLERLADNPNDDGAISKMRQMLAAKKAVMRVLALPDELIAKMKRLDVEDAATMSRRGAL